LESLYKNVKSEDGEVDIDGEVVADLVGDYLFTDEAFIQNLSANRNVFQKIYDKIKHLYKMATADSEQARQLEEVKRAFEKAYQQMGKGENVPGVTRSSVQYDLEKALKSLGEYDTVIKRQIESSGKDRVARDYNEIKEFIKHSKSNPPFERLHIGIISDETAAFVNKCTGEDITGYDFVLSSNFIYHIYDSHGNEATESPRGQKAVDDVNIENILEAVITPDDVRLVSDSTGTALRFEKDVEGRNIAITITSTKKSTLTLKSAWIIKEKSGIHTPSANANALAGTPEANSRNSTTNSIPETSGKSNPSDEIFSENSSKKRFALAEDAKGIENYTENERIIDRYARKKDTTKSFVKAKLEANPDFLKGFRFSLSENTADTDIAPIGDYNVYGDEIGYEGTENEDIGPVDEKKLIKAEIDRIDKSMEELMKEFESVSAEFDAGNITEQDFSTRTEDITRRYDELSESKKDLFNYLYLIL
jgi:hypothetical protein